MVDHRALSRVRQIWFAFFGQELKWLTVTVKWILQRNKSHPDKQSVYMLGFKTLAFLREWLGTPNKHENNNSGWRHPWIREQILFSGSYSQAWLARRMRMVGWSVIMEDFFQRGIVGKFRDYALSQDLLKGFQEPRVYCFFRPLWNNAISMRVGVKVYARKMPLPKFTAVAKTNLNQSATFFCLVPCSPLSFFQKILFSKDYFFRSSHVHVCAGPLRIPDDKSMFS